MKRSRITRFKMQQRTSAVKIETKNWAIKKWESVFYMKFVLKEYFVSFLMRQSRQNSKA